MSGRKNGRQLNLIRAITEINRERDLNPSRNTIDVIDEVCRRFNLGPADCEFIHSVFAGKNRQNRCERK